jgi:hypothetical protein
MKPYIKLLLLSVLILFITPAFSQQGVITGRVVDESTNEPIPFSSLLIFNTSRGTITDIDGNFRISGLSPGFIRLQVSYVGYETRLTEEILVTNARTSNITIRLRSAELELGAVEVNASAFERSQESPLSLRRLSIREIERSPGSNRDISRVIQSLPGVGFTPSFRNDVIIRGGGPSENRFFLDGIEIPNINHFATQGASGGPVGIINVDFIREVELYTGAFPANRGNALSSVLEMRQVNGNNQKINYRATVGASDLALTVDGPLSNNTTMIFSARRSYLQFIFGLIGLPFLPTYNGFQFKTNTSLSSGDLSFIGIGAIDQFELNLKANETEEQRFILDYLPVNQQWNYAIGSVFRRSRSNGFETWVLSRNMLRNTTYKHPENDVNLERIQDYVSDEIENKFRYERLLNSAGFRFIIGGGVEYARFNSFFTGKEFSFGQLLNISSTSELDMFKWSLFGQASRSVLENRLTLSLGLRADANTYNEQMRKLPDQLSPRLSASYRLQPELFINLSAGRFYQLPSYTTLGYADSQGVLVNRNNELKYISADHLVGGIEVLPSESSRITMEGFLKQYSNYPFSVRDSLSIGSRPADFGVFGAEEVTSSGQGRAFGLELLWQEQDLKKFNIILSYTFVRSEFKDAMGGYVPSAWDNRHIMILTLQRPLARNWEAGIKWRVSGGAPYTPYDLELSSNTTAWNARGRAYPDYSRFNQSRLPAFHQLDLRLDKQFYMNRWSLMLYFDVQNVYDFKTKLQENIVRVMDENGNPVIYRDGSVSRYQLKALDNITGSILPTVGIILEL